MSKTGIKKVAATLLAFLCMYTIQAQGIKIVGQLKDTASKENLTSATLKLFRVKDSVPIRQTISNKNGFVINRVPAGRYFLRASFVGYRDSVYAIILDGKDSIYNAGILIMTRSANNLMEVIVKATIPPVITKSDTIVYNTSEFKTRPNATVEELLKKLPGIEVDKDGNISFQGEKVQKIYIDGKEFFFNDPRIASQNLLADMVQKVEAFDDKSERAKLTGIPDDKPGKTLNLQLKPDKRKGYFGNVEAVYANLHNNTLNATASFLKGDAMAMVSAGNSNTGGGSISSDGKYTSLNYQNMLNKDLLYSMSYTGNANKNRSGSYNERQTFIADSSLLQEREGASGSEGSNHNFSFNLRYKVDAFSNLDLRAGAGLQQSTSNSSDLSGTSIDKGGNVRPVNSAATGNNTNDNSWNGNININYNRRFNKQGRSLGVSINSGRNERKGDGGLTSLTKFYDPFGTPVDSQERDQRFDQNAGDHKYGFRISYTEPVGKKQVLDFYYDLNNSNSNSDKTAFNYNPATGKYDQPDSLASNGFENRNLLQSVGIGYNNYKSSKFRYQGGIGMSKGRQQNNNKTANLADLAQTTTNIFPRASLMYSISKLQSIRLSYNGNSRQPLISELQPLPDFSNPLIVRLGNPSLKPEFSNQLSFEYRNFDAKKMRSITVNVNYRNTLNRIVNSATTNAQGIQELQYVNMNGGDRVEGMISYSTRLVKPKKPLSINYNVSIDYSRDANLVNKELNIRHSATTSQGLDLNYHLGEKLFASASAGFNLSDVKYSLQTTGSNTLISHRYNANLSYEFPKGWVFNTDFLLSFNSSRQQPKSVNSTVWNAGIMKEVLKDRKGELKLSFLDILNNKKDYNQTIGDNYIEITRTAVVKRIFKLSFIYRFRGSL